jgi:hypothetical protein
VPADRAFSGFLMRTRRGEAVKGFYEELTPEASHVREGFYTKRMKRFFDIFPRHQIKILIFVDFKKDSANVVVDLFDFLGGPELRARHVHPAQSRGGSEN